MPGVNFKKNNCPKFGGQWQFCYLCRVKHQNEFMKYSELHRRFIKAGYKFHHAEGSHYFYI